jgi:hypothetical protein
MMIGLFFISVLTVASLGIWRLASDAYLQGVQAADMQQNLRVAMDRITRTVQAAGTNPQNLALGEPGGVPNDPAFVAFREAGARCLRLYADLNGDGDVADPEENLYFTWTGNAGSPLTQQIDGGPDGGQPWVAATAGPVDELALGLVPNPGGTPLFQYFYGRNGGPGGEAPDSLIPLPPPPAPCQNLPPADRQRIGRILITLTVRGTVAGQTLTKTLVSESRPRNVP